MRAWAASRATMRVPVSSRRVLTGNLVRIARTLSMPMVEVDLDRRGEFGLFGGEIFFGVGFELFEEDAVLGDFAFDVAVGGAGDADADGATGGMAGQADDADVVGEVFAAELGADAGCLGDRRDALFPLEIAEGAAAGGAGGGQVSRDSRCWRA